MAYDDLPMGQPGPPPPTPDRPSSTARMVMVGAAGVAVGALLAWFWMSRMQPDPAIPAPTTASNQADGSNRPKRQPMNLPSLNGSDGLLRDLVAVLSEHPHLARLLATDDLVRNATLAVVQIGEGRTPVSPFEVLRTDEGVRITGTTSGAVDPASYTRWDAPTAALTSIRPADLAQAYVNVKPLFDEAYRELGYPQGDFDDALVIAIEVLDGTPDVTTDPVLSRRPEYFIHEDPTLRALEPVQKQFLLFGPTNRRQVMAWLLQFATALDLPLS